MSFNASGGSPFVPGPLPRNSLAAKINPKYSGLLECPVTTRLTKQIDADYAVVGDASAKCEAPIATRGECASAAAKTLVGAWKVGTQSVDTSAHPAGCSLTADATTGAVTAAGVGVHACQPNASAQ